MFKRFWKNFRLRNLRLFDIEATRPNILTLLTASTPFFLQANRFGHLKIIASKWRKLWWAITNLLLANYWKRRLTQTLKYSFEAFCNELYNPITLPILRQVMAKKEAMAQRFIEKLRKISALQKQPLEAFLQRLDQYRRSSILQERLIRSMLKATNRKSRRPLMQAVENALESGSRPALTRNGASGTYLISDLQAQPIAIFKPFDEDIFAPNNAFISEKNPIGHRHRRFGVTVSNAAHCEVAAALVSRCLGWDLVPETCYASLSHTRFTSAIDHIWHRTGPAKQGSLQTFVAGFIPLAEFPKEIGAMIPAEEIAKLFLLDWIVGNRDRHQENVLTDGQKLVAIDHGLSFPELFVTPPWPLTELPQSSLPFSEPILRTIATLSLEKLHRTLKKESYLSPKALQQTIYRTELLQKRVSAQFSPRSFLEHLSH